MSGIPTVKENRSFIFLITAIKLMWVKKNLLFSTPKCFGIAIGYLIKLVTAYKTYSVPI